MPFFHVSFYHANILLYKLVILKFHFQIQSEKPIIVSFEKEEREKKGEVGVDGGGLRENFLSMIVDYGFRVFERLGTEVGLDTANVDDIHFMLGVFLGKF